MSQLELTPAKYTQPEGRPLRGRSAPPGLTIKGVALSRVAARLRGEQRGFTVVELLVVVLLVGILAALALPAFLGQEHKGQDAEAKSTARNAMSVLESCYVERDDYIPCGAASQFAGSGLALGSGVNEVALSALGSDDYIVTVSSRSGNSFAISKTDGRAATFSW